MQNTLALIVNEHAEERAAKRTIGRCGGLAKPSQACHSDAVLVLICIVNLNDSAMYLHP